VSKLKASPSAMFFTSGASKLTPSTSTRTRRIRRLATLVSVFRELQLARALTSASKRLSPRHRLAYKNN
jgi:hypothetical protein